LVADHIRLRIALAHAPTEGHLPAMLFRSDGDLVMGKKGDEFFACKFLA